MEMTIQKSVSSVMFRNIKQGQVFKVSYNSKDIYCLKIGYRQHDYNGVNLDTGDLVFLRDDTPVIPCASKLIITEGVKPV